MINLINQNTSNLNCICKTYCFTRLLTLMYTETEIKVMFFSFWRFHITLKVLPDLSDYIIIIINIKTLGEIKFGLFVYMYEQLKKRVLMSNGCVHVRKFVLHIVL